MLKTLLFTFDYELFLGNRSGVVKDCLIDPTDRLLQLLSRYRFKGIFFVDTVYLIRLEEMAALHDKAAADLTSIRRQLGEIVGQGHAIFPHIHAHWLDAVYLPEKNEWTLQNLRYYQFASLPAVNQEALFCRSMQLIRDIGTDAGAAERIDGYRAGGWSIQPFSHFRPYFLQYGIEHEWSVIPGKYHYSDAHSFDFRKAPTDRPVYRFDDDPCIPEKNGPFREWTISTLDMKPFERWINFRVSGLLRRLGKREPLKGSTVSSVTKEQGDTLQRGVRVTASFEGLNPYILRKYLGAIRASDYYQFISHPKLLTSFEFGMIESLFRQLRRKSGIETDFRKITP